MPASLLLVLAVSAGCGSESVETKSPVEDLAEALAEAGFEAPLEVRHACEAGTVYRFAVDAEEAVATWERLRPLAGELGHYPVVCRDEGGLLAELPEVEQVPVADALGLAAKAGGSTWFEGRAASDPEYYGEVEQGVWEETEPQAGWVVPYDVLTGEPAPDVSILLVPTTRPWEVLAHLHYGGWNDCPAPEAHVAVQRHWYERYGAEIVCVTGDVVEMRVARPPAGEKTSQALAREQFLYSGGELVYQGYGTLNALAAALDEAEYWYFWWD